MPVSRWQRWAPITGLVGIILVVVAFVALGGSTPGGKASAEKVVRFFHAHRDRQRAAAFVLWWAATILIFFFGLLRAVLVRGTTGRLANIAFAGGIITVVGLYIMALMHFTLADSVNYAGPTISRTLNIIDNDNFMPMVGGLGIFGIATGWSVVRTRRLPLWLGIIALVAGVACFTPIGFLGGVLLGLWIITVSIWLTASPVEVAPAVV